MRLHIIALFLLCSVGLHAEATLDGVNLGTHICGPSISTSELKGKVVLFEYWGVNCPPCVASIPHLTHLQKQYGRDNFIILANHCQGGGAANTTKVWKGKATNDLVTVIDGGDLPNSKVSGIPRCFLFNHEGKLVFDGHPAKVDAALKEAMEASPGALVSGMDYKVFAKEARAIGSQKVSIGKTIGKLNKVKEGDKGREEASFLLKNIGEFVEKQKAKVETAKTEDPVQAMIIMNKMSGWLKGDDRADWFKDGAKALKKEDGYKDAVKATKMLLTAKAHADKLGLSKNPKQILATKSKAQQVKSIAGILHSIEKKYPDTKAAKDSQALRASWGL